MRLVYIAGRFSAPTREGIEANIRAAEDVGIEVARMGLFPVIPHANTARSEFGDVRPYEFWIRGTLMLMRACDLVLMLDGWEQSRGACGEHAEAKRSLMPVFYSLEQLKQWNNVEPF